MAESVSHAALVAAVRAMPQHKREQILQLVTTRVVDRYMTHIPHPKQQVFLSLMKREALFGGAAGGGKSDALLMAASQFVDVPGYSALILRRTWPDLNAPGAILDRARTWWKGTDAQEKEGGRTWLFPTKDRDGNDALAARITFGYLLHDKDKYKFQSAEFQFIGFDELTQFQDTSYTYMFSRLRRPAVSCLNCRLPVEYRKGKWRHKAQRSPVDNRYVPKVCDSCFPDPMVLDQYKPAARDGLSIFDIPLRMRSATNPGGVGHVWVRDRFIDSRTREQNATFVPSLLRDNPSLDQETYEENLKFLTPVDRQRLLDGDWDVVAEGDMFARHMFEAIDQEPVEGRAVRFWDNAATEGGGDYTVGAKLRLLPNGKWVVCSIIRGQWNTTQKETVMRQTAAGDGRSVRQVMEQEPGSAGKDVIDHMRRGPFLGYAFYGIRSTGSKSSRAVPMASAAGVGNIAIVTGRWNRDFLDEVSLFPNGANDDQVDACSGAYNFLSQAGSRIIV